MAKKHKTYLKIFVTNVLHKRVAVKYKNKS